MSKLKIPKLPLLSEHEEQKKFLEWFAYAYANKGVNKGPVRILSLPNGGLRNIVVAKKMKDEGLKKGVPDLFIPEWLVFIEMKRVAGGRLSNAQKDWFEYLTLSGYTCILAHGADDAIKQVMVLKPLQ